jgi:hypothetical protein
MARPRSLLLNSLRKISATSTRKGFGDYRGSLSCLSIRSYPRNPMIRGTNLTASL